MDPITNRITKTLTGLLSQGWEPPFYFASISINGSFSCGRYDANGQGGFEVTLVGEHIEGTGHVLPIHLLITNGQGHVTRLVCGPTDDPEVSH